jgi:hypothetical protein
MTFEQWWKNEPGFDLSTFNRNPLGVLKNLAERAWDAGSEAAYDAGVKNGYDAGWDDGKETFARYD